MPDFARHALHTARRHSGCRVFALSDYGDPDWHDARQAYSARMKAAIQIIKANNAGVIPREAYMIFRWLVLADFIEANHIGPPIISLDWDMLTFGPLWPHFVKCGIEQADFGTYFDRERSQEYMEAFPVMNLRCVTTFCDFVLAMLKAWPPGLVNERRGFRSGGDMLWWHHMATVCRYKVADIGRVVDGALFDPNIILNQDQFEHDDWHGKKIVMKGGKPHFVLKTGALVRALTVHCFMEWKNRTAELLR